MLVVERERWMVIYDGAGRLFGNDSGVWEDMIVA